MGIDPFFGGKFVGVDPASAHRREGKQRNVWQGCRMLLWVANLVNAVVNGPNGASRFGRACCTGANGKLTVMLMFQAKLLRKLKWLTTRNQPL
ncbi:hypothetical protein KC335_g12 [Hortaea werneckii]|nr:hypothetical protein KC335_g12 [Hortaea werneckii]